MRVEPGLRSGSQATTGDERPHFPWDWWLAKIGNGLTVQHSPLRCEAAQCPLWRVAQSIVAVLVTRLNISWAVRATACSTETYFLHLSGGCLSLS